ncbi:MAG: helix-turn-helix domain-containing protein [Actinomycetota bacterium]
MATPKNPTRPLFDQPTVEFVAQRLRTLRKERGWSLSDVEKRSAGRITAVTLGSYERGDRTLSVKRSLELATFFGVPITHLFGSSNVAAKDGIERPIIDLRKLRRFSEENGSAKSQFLILQTFLTWIVAQRQDWNGEVLSLRASDISLLALLLTMEPTKVIDWLREHKLLIEERVRP